MSGNTTCSSFYLDMRSVNVSRHHCLDMRSVIVSLHHCIWICGVLLSRFIIVSGYAVCYCLSSSLCLDMRSVIVFSRKGSVCMYCNANNACKLTRCIWKSSAHKHSKHNLYSSGNQCMPYSTIVRHFNKGWSLLHHRHKTLFLTFSGVAFMAFV